MAQEASKKRAELLKSNGGSRRKADLCDPTKWGRADLAQFGQVLLQYAEDLDMLQHNREKQSDVLRELKSNMLKGEWVHTLLDSGLYFHLTAGTRREEIIRFNKAKNDAEFAKMLKARTLGPEHLETQTQLRRNIRVCSGEVHDISVAHASLFY